MKREVKRGIRLLDKNEPGWRNKINCNKLDLKSGHNCILGQLYGDYATGTRQYSLLYNNSNELARHGFELPSDTSINLKRYYARWTRLTELWKEELCQHDDFT